MDEPIITLNEEVASLDHGEMLMIRRMLHSIEAPEVPTQQDKLFH